MKILLALVLFTLPAAGFSQVKKAPEFVPFKELIKNKGVEKIEFHFPLAYNNKRRIQHKDGKVIQLPLDNMPCLVPDVKGFNMPVSGGNTLSNMPVLGLVPVK